MAVEAVTVMQWLYSTLTAATGIDWYPDIAAEEASFPRGVFSLQSSRDENSIGGRGLALGFYQAQVVGEGLDYAALQSYVDLVDTALHGAITVVAGVNLRCKRVSQIAYPEIYSDRQYAHLGGIYQVYAS